MVVFMDSARRLRVVALLLVLMLVLAGGVSASRSIKTTKEEGLSLISHDGVKNVENDAMKMERRMDIQVNDYPGAGANHNHDPTPPGRKG